MPKARSAEPGFECGMCHEKFPTPKAGRDHSLVCPKRTRPDGPLPSWLGAPDWRATSQPSSDTSGLPAWLGSSDTGSKVLGARMPRSVAARFEAYSRQEFRTPSHTLALLATKYVEDHDRKHRSKK